VLLLHKVLQAANWRQDYPELSKVANLNGGTCLLGSSVVHWRRWVGTHPHMNTHAVHECSGKRRTLTWYCGNEAWRWSRDKNVSLKSNVRSGLDSLEE